LFLILDPERQQAIDYLTGSMPEDDRLLYESKLESDEPTRLLVSEVSDDWSSLALLSNPSSPDPDLRNRTLLLTQEPEDLSPILECPELARLRDNYSKPTQRYTGGDATVDLSDVRDSKAKDTISMAYENLLSILPMVSGDSPAAFGDFAPLSQFAKDHLTGNHNPLRSASVFSPKEDLVDLSVQRSMLASLPSLLHFLEIAGSGKVGLSEVRRIFYLCRDQLKIMRASFRDLDPGRLAEDELIRLHGTHLLRQKWTGARHAFFSSSGLANCGNFFEGPISERCVEFAEYDSNLYCLANLMANRSSSGGFQLELIKDAIPGCALAVVHAEVNDAKDAELSAISSCKGKEPTGHLSNDSCLWSLLRHSMNRGFPHHSIGDLAEASFFGKTRRNGKSYLWFTWPEIENIQEGAVASTEKPGQ
jgi:hypothetical protein